ncbi:hypothetical protein GCM10011613_36480 [Cellvibrio zantedeschiae]|uniref:DUF1318 domain-containing protein n=1 Tax=Cellvibrio zantedeschiae TaxID=1237077 RepID=A0ABQ3BBA1_9GAMM|nr:hypothetical protein [Cellvibrio zantedeschiae]GGY88138.1 hypothetical protein GCM10011613_36480 [Cellvibrio zantedeschiae]
MIKTSGTYHLLILALVVSVSACSTQDKKSKKDSPDVPQQIGAAVTAPLNDLNLIQTAIPEVLRSAQKNPYAVPSNNSCDSIGKEISALNEVLGADLDTPVIKKSEGLLERNLVSESVSSIRRTTESVVPFRNWVRKLSGAERKSNAVKSAITAGSIRRAYLKGYGQANKCPAPAAPQVIAVQH